MLKAICLAAGWLVMSPAVAQTGQPEASTPSTSAPMPAAPVIGGPPPAIVGLSACENLIGLERENCLKDERARLGSAGGRSAGAGGTHAPGSTGTGHGSAGAQNIAPSGSTR